MDFNQLLEGGAPRPKLLNGFALPLLIVLQEIRLGVIPE